MNAAITRSETIAKAAETFRAWWKDAYHVLVGAGAGLSAAAGIDYTDPADFARTFPVLARKGFRARYQLIGYDAWPPEQQWAYWATHVNDIRFRTRTHPVYAGLRDLLKDKDTFVLTSNVDAMFERHGFDPQKIFTPQGDYAAMQCRTPCRQVVWPSQPALEQVLRHVDQETFTVTDPAALPVCPNCGGEVFLNVRLDDGFVEAPYEAQEERMHAWAAKAAKDKRGEGLLLLEFGAGFNTPTVVRWKMERLAHALPAARFIRVNRDHGEIERLSPDRALGVTADAGAIIEAFTRVAR